ncbi:MAG: hypothetical protein MUF38_03890 [Anaerolineae bacterium]|jgi:predicted outer membrane repeat protein|nr:hypothetical protein [Anaerolineae bacterium]
MKLYFRAVVIGCLGVLWAVIASTSAAQVTMIVNCGDTVGLAAAITTANATPQSDNINIIGTCAFTFTQPDATHTDSALPRITAPLVINGSGATLERADGSPEFRLLYAEGESLTLNYLTLTGGYLSADNGGAIYAGSSETIFYAVTLTGNTAQNGGAVYASGELQITTSTLSANTAAVDGGAIYQVNFTGLVVTNSKLIGNAAARNGGAVYHMSGFRNIFTGVTMSGNSAGESGGAWYNNGVSVSQFILTTVAGNKAGISAGGLYYQNHDSIITHSSIIWGNLPDGAYGPMFPSIAPSYSIIEGGWFNEALDVDPLFVAPQPASAAPTTAGDYRIQPNSPAIDAGDTTLPDGILYDLYDVDGDGEFGELMPDMDGTTRPQYSKYDIGSDEVDYCLVYAVPYTVPAGDTADLVKAILCANLNTDLNTFYLSEGVYLFTAGHSSDITNALPEITTPISLVGLGTGATLSRDSTAPNFRFLELRSGAVVSLENLTLTGGSSSNLSGGAIYVLNSNLSLERVTMSSNVTLSEGGGLFADGSTLTIRDSTFTNNTSPRGGALAVQFITLNMVNTTVAGNMADGDGGGMSVLGGSSQVQVVNSLFSGNVSGFEGGGLKVITGAVNVINSTFVGNTAQVGGGGIYNNFNLNLTNSIVWGNNGGAVTSDIGVQTTVSTSLVEGGANGTGNLDADPLFISPVDASSAPTTEGNYRLQDNSPAINAGNSAALPADSFDLDGDSDTIELLPLDADRMQRVVGGSVDMGAYETTALGNLILNGSFETAGDTNATAQNWVFTNGRRRNTGSIPDGSFYALVRVGSSLKQNLNLTRQPQLAYLTEQDSLTLSFSAKQGSGPIANLRIFYTDGTVDRCVLTNAVNSEPLTDWETETLTCPLDSTVSRVVVQFRAPLTATSALRLDAVSLTASQTMRTTRGTELLPLPELPDGFRGSN